MGKPKYINVIELYKYSVEHPEFNNKEVGQFFGIKPSSVTVAIQSAIRQLRGFWVVPSLDVENTYFVINNLNERKFTVDINGFILQGFKFNTHEKKELIRMGFKI